MNSYQVANTLTWMGNSLSDLRIELDILKNKVNSGAATTPPIVPAAAVLLPVPAPVSVPVSVPIAAISPALDVQALRTSIEVGLRTSIRAALHSDIQQGLKDERQLTESSLMIRYDAMVSRMVKDRMLTAVAELRGVVEDSIGNVASHSFDASVSAKAAVTASTDACNFAEEAKAAILVAGSSNGSVTVSKDTPDDKKPVKKKSVARPITANGKRGGAPPTVDIATAMSLGNLSEDLFVNATSHDSDTVTA